MNAEALSDFVRRLRNTIRSRGLRPAIRVCFDRGYPVGDIERGFRWLLQRAAVENDDALLAELSSFDLLNVLQVYEDERTAHLEVQMTRRKEREAAVAAHQAEQQRKWEEQEAARAVERQRQAAEAARRRDERKTPEWQEAERQRLSATTTRREEEKQRREDRRELALRLRQDGNTYVSISKHLGITIERARQLVMKAARDAEKRAHLRTAEERLRRALSPKPAEPGNAAFHALDVLHTPESEYRKIEAEGGWVWGR